MPKPTKDDVTQITTNHNYIDLFRVQLVGVWTKYAKECPMSDCSHPLLEEYKTQASLLLKKLRSTDSKIATTMALRFQQLPHFSHLPLHEIPKSDRIRRKHALAVIAREHGFDSWANLKNHLERKEKLAQLRGDYYTPLYPARCGGYLLEWHSDYAVASEALGHSAGYLFPYKNQFFICEAAYIVELGLDPDDSDWERIGYNWVKPTDQAAWLRLNRKLHEQAQFELSNHPTRLPIPKGNER